MYLKKEIANFIKFYEQAYIKAKFSPLVAKEALTYITKETISLKSSYSNHVQAMTLALKERFLDYEWPDLIFDTLTFHMYTGSIDISCLYFMKIAANYLSSIFSYSSFSKLLYGETFYNNIKNINDYEIILKEKSDSLASNNISLEKLKDLEKFIIFSKQYFASENLTEFTDALLVKRIALQNEISSNYYGKSLQYKYLVQISDIINAMGRDARFYYDQWHYYQRLGTEGNFTDFYEYNAINVIEDNLQIIYKDLKKYENSIRELRLDLEKDSKIFSYFKETAAIYNSQKYIMSQANYLNNLGQANNALSNYEKAIDYLLEFLNISSVLAYDKQKILSGLQGIFKAYHAKQEYDEAFKYAERTLIEATYPPADRNQITEILNEICLIQPHSTDSSSKACVEAKEYIQNNENAYLSLDSCNQEDTLIISFQTLAKQWKVCDL